MKCQVLVNIVMNVQVPQKASSFLTSLAIISFSRKAMLHVVNVCAVFVS
jgi:hypothetical protein